MKRREFLKRLTTFLSLLGCSPDVTAKMVPISPSPLPGSNDAYIKDYLHKIRNFNAHHNGDIYMNEEQYDLLKTSLNRLKRVQQIVGHGNFYLLSFDEALKVARNYSRVGKFKRSEIDFLEMIFYEEGSLYGFLGDKPLKKLTARISKKQVVKIPYSGNYIYKGRPLYLYKKIKKDVGDQVILTSGIRSVIKQFMLFLNKAYQNRGNLSLASRSLAPPGYSYHAIGDFDLGQMGLGADNFTERFTTTPVFRKLKKLGYIDLRYRADNLLGVRFEPWHIKISPQRFNRYTDAEGDPDKIGLNHRDEIFHRDGNPFVGYFDSVKKLG